jgi:hypothetical protein
MIRCGVGGRAKCNKVYSFEKQVESKKASAEAGKGYAMIAMVCMLGER